MAKKYSTKFWVIFWLISVIFLIGWGIFWQVKNSGLEGWIAILKPAINTLPMSEKSKEELGIVMQLAEDIASGEEKTFLVLFQNNNELRPGGGYIGSFGILKIKDKSVTFIDTHDTNVFDSGGDTGIETPYPMGEMLNIPDWELRDSNWSPDFSVNAEKAEEFYHLEGGGEELDGVIAMSTEMLPAFLEITGPITIDGYPGEYTSENAIMKLQYQVERGFREQNIEKGERKYIMKELAKELAKKSKELSLKEKGEAIGKIEELLDNKDIMVYLKNDDLQDKLRSLGWSGEVKTSESDYFMIVDANLGSFKTDQVMDRSAEYLIDFSGEKPKAILKITYTHNGESRDWLTKDYNVYTRVYVPEGSWLHKIDGIGGVRFGNELGKKYFGFIHRIKLGETKIIEILYDLPESITEEDYKLMIQKQSGIDELPVEIIVIGKDGEKKIHNVVVKNETRI